MKNILFPFNIEHDNKAAYVKAMKMAKQENARVILFTSLPELISSAKDKVYFHLLDLFGHYQTQHNDWQVTSNTKVKTKRVIVSGDFETALKNFLAHTPINWVVPTTALEKTTLVDSFNEMLKNNKNVSYPHLSLEQRRGEN